MGIKVAVMSGFGINCERETQYAFELAGRTLGVEVKADKLHINDLIAGQDIRGTPLSLEDYQILAFPGGFSYGDDTGSGNAFAKKVRDNIWGEVEEFIKSDKLVLGICNGCQITSILGIAPALDGQYGKHEVDFRHNDSVTYEDRWVMLKNHSSKSVFTKGIEYLRVPVAHGEGKFDADPEVLEAIEAKGLVAFTYIRPDYYPAEGKFPYNPNGSLHDIAGITDESGRVLIMMPHPERSVRFTQLPDWTRQKQSPDCDAGVPGYGPGLKVFCNAVEYFK